MRRCFCFLLLLLPLLSHVKAEKRTATQEKALALCNEAATILADKNAQPNQIKRATQTFLRAKATDIEVFANYGGYYNLAVAYAMSNNPDVDLHLAMYNAEQALLRWGSLSKKDVHKLYNDVADKTLLYDLYQSNLSADEMAEEAFKLLLFNKKKLALACLNLAQEKGKLNHADNIHGVILFNNIQSYSDFDKIVDAFRRGANAGDPIAKYNLAFMLYEGWYTDSKTVFQDKVKGRSLYEQALPQIMAMNLDDIHPALFIAPLDNTISLEQRLKKAFNEN